MIGARAEKTGDEGQYKAVGGESAEPDRSPRVGSLARSRPTALPTPTLRHLGPIARRDRSCDGLLASCLLRLAADADAARPQPSADSVCFSFSLNSSGFSIIRKWPTPSMVIASKSGA